MHESGDAVATIEDRRQGMWWTRGAVVVLVPMLLVLAGCGSSGHKDTATGATTATTVESATTTVATGGATTVAAHNAFCDAIHADRTKSFSTIEPLIAATNELIHTVPQDAPAAVVLSLKNLRRTNDLIEVPQSQTALNAVIAASASYCK